jgi:hypothetical protein
MRITKPLNYVLGLLVGVAAFTTGLVGQAYASTTTLAPGGILRINQKPVFPVMLSYGPPTLSGLRRVAADGVNIYKYQPPRGTPWGSGFTTEAIAAARAYDARIASIGGVTEVNLCAACGYPKLGNISGALLAQVSASLAGDPGFGFYKGADEPWWNQISAASLVAPFQATRASDPEHLWTEFQADRGGRSDFRPYAATTNIGGVAVFPVRSRAPIGSSGTTR